MTFSMNADQEVPVTLTFVDKYNNPVTAPTGVPVWSVDQSTILTVNAAADGLSATCVAVGPVGTATVTVTLDGVTGSEVFDVTPGAVTSITLVPGTAANHP